MCAEQINWNEEKEKNQLTKFENIKYFGMAAEKKIYKQSTTAMCIYLQIQIEMKF